MPITASKYKNIIFDLGGVLLNINHSLTVKAFSDLGFQDFNVSFSYTHQKQFFDLYEKGLVSSKDFRNQIKTYFGKDIENKTFDTAWNAMLLNFPSDRARLLQKLKTTHRTFLLSNTNEIHFNTFKIYLQKNYGIKDLSGHFEKIYLSFKLGMRKPDPEIFELVLSENSLNPHETLFIDDSIQHIEAAKKLGIQTYWLDLKNESVMSIFK